jgi:hypothetical protein
VKFPDSSVENVSKVRMHMPVQVGDFAGQSPPELVQPPPQNPRLTTPRLLMLPRARPKRRPDHYQRCPPATRLLPPTHRLPRPGQLHCGVRDRHRAAARPVPR